MNFFRFIDVIENINYHLSKLDNNKSSERQKKGKCKKKRKNFQTV